MNYRQKEAQLDFQTALRQLGEIRAERDRYKKALTQIVDRSNRFSNSIAYKIAAEALEGVKASDNHIGW